MRIYRGAKRSKKDEEIKEKNYVRSKSNYFFNL